MKTTIRMSLRPLGVAALALWLCSQPTAAAQWTPITTVDPDVPEAELELLLRPLTKAETEVEALAWRDLMRAKVEAWVDCELKIRRGSAHLRQAGATAEALEEAADAIDAQAKSPSDANRTAVDERRKAAADAVRALAAQRAALVSIEVKPAAVDEADAAQLRGWAKELRDGVKNAGHTRESLTEDAVALRAARDRIAKRVRVALEAFELRGGDPSEIEKHIDAMLARAEADLSDASTIWVRVKSWLLSADGGIDYALRILEALAVLIATWFLAGLIGRLVRKILSHATKISRLLEGMIVSWVRRVILVVGLVVAITTMGVDMTPVLAIIGAAGLVVGLALQGTLGNFASGLLILFYRPFDVGDVVEVGGVNGKIEALNIMCTSVRTFDNKLIILQNSKVWGDSITNHTGLSDTRRVDMVFGIGYADDIDRAHAVLADIVAKHPKVLETPAPNIRLHELADSSVNFIVRPWSKPDDYWDIYWDVTREVKKRFDAEGISIPFPQRDVHVYHESTPPATEPVPALAAVSTTGNAPTDAPKDAPTDTPSESDDDSR